MLAYGYSSFSFEIVCVLNKLINITLVAKEESTLESSPMAYTSRFLAWKPKESINRQDNLPPIL